MGLISNGTTVFDAGAMSLGGSMTFIKKLTASSSATLSFVDGTDGVVLDDTYKEYMFTFKDIHPANNDALFQFNMSIDTGSNYNVHKTSTSFRARHQEGGSNTALEYRTAEDLAQGTGFQTIVGGIGSDADQSASGTLSLFNPSSTTFVKHFIANLQEAHEGDYSIQYFTSGYGNNTSAVDAIQFKMNSGNIDAGDICLYGIS